MRTDEQSRATLPHRSPSGWKNAFSRLALLFLVHLDALRKYPAGYFAAVWQRVLGKRLRARLMMAPLLGKSPRSYRLWQLRQAASKIERTGSQDGHRDGLGKVRLFAAVLEGAGLDETLASLARERIDASVVKEMDAVRTDIFAGKAEGPDDWIMTIPSGDTLALGAGAVYRDAAAAASPSVKIIYADDDLATDGKPHFKPEWNRELFNHMDFLSGAAIVRFSACLQGDHSPGLCAPAHIARTIDSDASSVLHVAQILHHRQTRPSPQRPGPVILSSEQRAGLPSVSVIVPTRNRADLLRTCLEGLQRTDYSGGMETLVIDNGSDDPETLQYLASLDRQFARPLHMPGAFNFAAINNAAVAQASGELICFLNNDVETTTRDWLETLAFQALRPEVGAVGAQLLYPSGRIQHAGVVLGIGGGAAHAHRLLRPEEEGYFHRHALPQFVSAVTAACLVVRKDRFLAVGGFDAANFAVAFNDVDLCLKLNKRGWQSLYEPRARLVHHESVSRGTDGDPVGARRLEGELAALQQRWGIAPPQLPGRTVDPFHHPALSPFSENFVLHV